MRLYPFRFFALFLFWITIPMTARPQDSCPMPAYSMPPGNAQNIFSELQENDLGDVIAEHVQRNYRVIDDDVTDNLRSIGRRLLAQLPPSNLRFEFYIIDLPQINALCIPGGRIYVTRKMIAASHSEDELAAVLGHEIGHAITRRSSIELTQIFQRLLGVTSVGDRKDIFDKYNQLIDNFARKPASVGTNRRFNEEDEIAMDRISMYLAKRAGYSPEAGIALWNRASEVGGKKGNFLGDFFGLTKPEQKRLREMQRTVEQLPDSCAGPRQENTAAGYEEWKATVMAYSGLGRRESLPSAERKRLLTPHLQGHIRHLRFSQDGRYLLAQDSSSIFVLSRDPFEVLFRIHAPDASAAQFTPDSRSVVFYTSQLRVETWDIEEEQRSDLKELVQAHNCYRTRLSPDGKHLACMDPQNAITVFHVLDGSQVFHKKLSGAPTRFSMRFLFSPYIAQLEFSLDGRYFLAINRLNGQHCAFDLAEGKPLNLPASIKERLDHSFAFMSEGRFIGIAGNKGEKSAIVRFPSGEIQKVFQVQSGQIYPATHGDYLILRPLDKFPAGLVDLSNNKILLTSKQDALDVYDDYFVSERVDGTLSLFQTNKEAPLGQAMFPKSPLPRSQAVAVSADMNWLAVSENTRGAIWDLRTGQLAYHTPSFTAAQFTSENMLVADFPKMGNEERMIAQIDLAGPKVSPVAKLANRRIHQDGRYLIEQSTDLRNGKNKGDPKLIVSSAENGKELWSRTYPQGIPWLNIDSDHDSMVFVWSASSDFVKEEAKIDPGLKSRIESKKERQGDYFIRIEQASTGASIGRVYVETGMASFRLRWAEAAGDYLALYDSENRLLLYSIADGKRLGQVFGSNGTFSPASKLLVAENEPGILSVYSLPAMEKRMQLAFSDPIAYIQFSRDGKHLFVLTAGQVTYLFDTQALKVSTLHSSGSMNAGEL